MAEAHWTMDVDNADVGGTIFAHLTGDQNDPIVHPVMAGRIHLRFRDSQIQKLADNESYTMDVVEVPANDFVKEVAPLRFWVVIDNAAAVTGINGRDRMGPYEPEAHANVAGELVANFRDQAVFQVLKQGLTYQITLTKVA